ncbi:MAG: hypothetical protein Q4G08_04085 [Capnocytophaga sp.]|nr:hypothetical protein [Capnocytophaga sp.]
MITKPQIKQLQTLCSSRFSDREERLEFLSAMAGEPVQSAKELTQLQADGIIRYLNTGKASDNSYYARFDKENNQHRTILSLAFQFGWVGTTDSGRTVPDLERLGSWLISKRSPVQKPLLKMTRPELSKVITALERMTVKKFQ